MARGCPKDLGLASKNSYGGGGILLHLVYQCQWSIKSHHTLCRHIAASSITLGKKMCIYHRWWWWCPYKELIWYSISEEPYKENTPTQIWFHTHMNWNASYLYLYLHLNGTFYVDTCLYWNNSWKCFRCNSSASSFVKCVFVRSAVAVFFVLYKSNPAKASKAFEEKGGTWSCNTNTTQPSPSTPILGTFQTFLRYSWEFFDGFESVIGYFYGFVLCQRGEMPLECLPRSHFMRYEACLFLWPF